MRISNHLPAFGWVGIGLAASLAVVPGAVRAQATELVYSNSTRALFFPIAEDTQVADDLFLGNQCVCKLRRFEFSVNGGGDGTGPGFTVNYGLYEGCPSTDGVLLEGTGGAATLPDDGDHTVVHEYVGDELNVDSPVWLAISFDRNGCGWYMGEAPEVGFSADVYDYPFFPCEAQLAGTPFYASFASKVYCEELEGPLVQSPNPADGSTGVSSGTAILTWNEFSTVASTPVQDESPDLVTPENFVDGTEHPDVFLEMMRDAVEAGEVPDPLEIDLPRPEPRSWFGGVAGTSVPTVTSDDIFFFEDTQDLIATGFTNGQLFQIMGQATNAVISQYGDNFDFVGFFVNFVPHHQIGAAFYLGLFNDVSGVGLGNSNNRAAYGVLSDEVEGFVMMWRESSWALGYNTFTQLVLGQEFEHRFAMFLDPLTGNRPLQGNNGSCGRSAHWNFRVDGQGSGMEIAEWVGSSPAQRIGGSLNFNTDIAGSVFSYPDLYLMGYVSPEEMDANSSELRYMDTSTCQGNYSGNISNWDSAAVIGTNGPRTPNSFFAQKHFNTAWVMLHRPGLPPNSSQVNKVVDILNTWNEVYITSVLERGTMSNVLQPVVQPSACDTVYDVRLGTENPPEDLICENLLDPMCDPGELDINTQYFWQVNGTKSDRTTTGPVWSFDTNCLIGASTPPGCAIDARQPHDVNNAGALQGWDQLTMTFLCDTAGIIAEDFEISVEEGPAPIVTSLQSDGLNVTMQLSEPIPPGQWTCITHTLSGAHVCLGSLPGDVNGDGVASSNDILALIDALNGIENYPDYGTDTDRSGQSGPADILRVIDLLNGAGEFDTWLDASLEACPG